MPKPSERVCRRVEYFTPPPVLEAVRAIFGGPIDFDPFTCSKNPTEAERFLTKENDALTRPWPGDLKNCFANPPYGDMTYPSIDRVVTSAENNTGAPHALLLAASARWEQPGWWRIFSPRCVGMFLFRKRVKYLDENHEVIINEEGKKNDAPNYPSILFLYNVDVFHVKNVVKLPGKLVPVFSIG